MMDHVMKHIPVLGKTQAQFKETRPAFSGALKAEAPDTFQPRFAGTMHLESEPTIAGSHWKNEMVQVDPTKLGSELVVRLDEIMTTSGEAYAVTPERKAEGLRSEAFTLLLDVNFTPEAQKDFGQSGSMNITTDAQVEATEGATMGLSSVATDFETGLTLAAARANFIAMDAASFADPSRKPEMPDVTPLKLSSNMQERSLNQTAKSWNEKLGAFYAPIGKRLGHPKVAHPDLRELRSPVRMINDNDYVTPKQLNKKHSGHGGVTAGMAMENMKALASRYLNEVGFAHSAVQVDALTASFARPYFETDSLQFDTSIDHINEQGKMYMSTRVSRHDTQGGKIEGPVFMFHSVLSHKPPKTSILSLLASADKATVPPPMDQYIQDDEARQRQEEAKQWASL